jgi:hypothetical protein
MQPVVLSNKLETTNAMLVIEVKNLKEELHSRHGEDLSHKKRKDEPSQYSAIPNTYCLLFLNGVYRHQHEPHKCYRLHRTLEEIAQDLEVPVDLLQLA